MKFTLNFYTIMVRVGLVILGLVPLANVVCSQSQAAQEAVETSPTDTPSALQNLLEGQPFYRRDKRGFSIPFQDVERLYEKVGFQPFWFTSEALTQCKGALIDALTHVDREGLDQRDYVWALALIAKWEEGDAVDRDDLLRADVLLSHLLLQYISDLRGERLSPKTIDKELYMDKPTIDEVSLFLNALRSDHEEGCQWLDALPPQSKAYSQLRDELHRLQEGIEGDNETKSFPQDAGQKAALHHKVPFHPSSKQGKTRTREEKIKQLIVTMERLRWMPDNWGEKYVLVNIPAFTATAVSHGKTVFTMPIIVGKSYRETPVFNSEIINIIVNPSWNVPRMIAVKDKLPLIKRQGASYLTSKKIHVYRDGQEVSPSSINWQAINGQNFDLHFRQDPGSLNALGRIRFTIPNPFSVYLHGTPQQKLFDEKKRTFSSGCIRLEDPDKMALFVLDGNTGDWTLEKIKAAIDKGSTRTITLDNPISTYLQYLTVVVNDEGHAVFLDDIYGQDKQISAALSARHAQGP